MRVHKFGGSSLKTAERMARAAQLVSSEPALVVVSAMGGVTDALYEISKAAAARDDAWTDAFSALFQRHLEVAAILAPDDGALTDTLRKERAVLDEVLSASAHLGTQSKEARDFIVGHGELWSARIMSAHLSCDFVDARDFLVTADGRVDMARTQANWRTPQRTAVITGFICKDVAGVVTTLARNGSDHTASVVAHLADAAQLTIWSDVDGVLSADPRKVPDAVVTAQLSYLEAAELSYFGAEVLHPETMGPVIEKQIPVRLKNTLNPEAPGTLISRAPLSSDDDTPVKGFASIDDVALVNVEGRGMVGVPGVAQRLFGALREVDINVILIAQASSEQSVCFAIQQSDAARAKKVLEEAFYGELAQKRISRVSVLEDCAILAAVGADMARTPGVSGRLLSALGKVGVNVRAMAQGAGEINISVVVDKADAERGLRAAHAAFYLSEQTLAIGLIGPGLIGKELLRQIKEARTNLKAQYGIHLVVRAILRSAKMSLGHPAVDLDALDLDALDQDTDLAAFEKHLETERIPHACIIDCTASERFAPEYPSWLARRLHIITPNKKPNTGAYRDYAFLKEVQNQSRAHYFYEATVGAGLPVISTLRDLLLTGDRVHRIEGVLSGTLSYLMNGFAPEQSFAELVIAAKARGFTEPDPRDDLSGMDVARKALILARELGLELELDDIEVESLIPGGLANASSIDAFLEGLKGHDDQMRARARAAEARDEVLRYVARVDAIEKTAHVGLQSVPRTSALASLTGTDNVIAFTTERYLEQPLLVRGPGAGPAVTAGGVFADLLRLCARLGARS